MIRFRPIHSVGVLFAIIVLLAALMPLQTARYISSCGDGTTQLIRSSIIMHHKSIAKWKQQVEENRYLTSGAALCIDESIDSTVIEKLYIL